MLGEVCVQCDVGYEVVVVSLGGVDVAGEGLLEADAFVDFPDEFFSGYNGKVVVSNAADFFKGVSGADFEAQGHVVFLDEVVTKGDCRGDAVVDVGNVITEEA